MKKRQPNEYMLFKMQEAKRRRTEYNRRKCQSASTGIKQVQADNELIPYDGKGKP